MTDPRGRTPHERAAAALEDVGLDPALLARRPHELSGGQRQRVVIARALVSRPRLVLCDEPVSALDASSRIHVLDLFRRLRDRHGLSILFVSHDIGSLAATSDRLVVLHEGVVVQDGTPQDVVGRPTHPYVRRLVAAVPRLPARAVA